MQLFKVNMGINNFISTLISKPFPFGREQAFPFALRNCKDSWKILLNWWVRVPAPGQTMRPNSSHGDCGNGEKSTSFCSRYKRSQIANQLTWKVHETATAQRSTKNRHIKWSYKNAEQANQLLSTWSRWMDGWRMLYAGCWMLDGWEDRRLVDWRPEARRLPDCAEAEERRLVLWSADRRQSAAI